MRQKFVLDTTAITDTGMREREGYDNICQSADYIMDLIADARLKLDITCYIPYPTVYTELVSFLKRYKCPENVFLKLDTWLIKKTPNRIEVMIPSAIFYEYVLTMRQRINKGRRIAEEFIWESSVISSKADSKNVEREIGNLIAKFRDKYRSALRQDVLDSSPDIDVLLLAKELDASVVSSDAGIRRWAEMMGLRFVEASKFPSMLKEYLSRKEKE